MSRLFSQLIIATFAAFSLPFAAAVDVSIPDARLEALVRSTLSKPTGSLTDADLALLTNLNVNSLPASSEKISDLTGLEYAVNLILLNLPSQNISDASPLSELTGLNSLFLSGNAITDVSAIASIGSLTSLDLSSNNIGNIAPLNQLTSLTSLSLRGTKFTSLELIDHLTALQALDLNNNRLITLEGIDQFPSLTQLQVSSNFLTDITPALDSDNLTLLSLQQNYIDFSPGSANAAALVSLQASGVAINNTAQRAASLAIAANQVEDPYHLDGGDGSLSVSSNSYWHVSSDVDWLTITSPEYAFENDPITFSVAESLSLQGARIATITVQDLSNTRTFQVVQRPLVTVNIPDAILEQALRTAVQNFTEPLTDHQLERITELEVEVSPLSSNDRKIHSLTGLKYALNLQTLLLDNHGIADLSPLSGLVHLQEVSLANNVISSLNGFLFQTALLDLDLSQNFLTEQQIANSAFLNSIRNRGGTVLTDNQQTPTISLSLSTNVFTLAGGRATLEIESNYTWTATSDSDWLVFPTGANTSTNTLSGTRNASLRFEVAEIETLAEARVATFTVLGETITVTQRFPIPVAFADPDLANILRAELNLADGATITDFALRSLTSLDLSRNTLDPDVTSLDGLEYAINLQTLSIANHSLPSLEALTELDSLRELELIGVPLQDFSALSSLTHLESLTLENCGLTQIPELNCEDTLTSIDLSDNQLVDISPIARLPLLTYADLSYNPIFNISPLSTLSQLSILDLSETQPQSLIPLVSLGFIQELYLAETGIDDLSYLSDVHSIRILDITANNIESLAPLAQLTSLREIYGQGNFVEDLSPILPLPNLAIIEFPNNRIHDLEPFEIAPNTEHLDLSSNYIDDLSPLGGMTNLLSLRIAGNNLDLAPASVQSSELQALADNGTNVFGGTNEFQRKRALAFASSSFSADVHATTLSIAYSQSGYIETPNTPEWISMDFNRFGTGGTLRVFVEENPTGENRSATIDFGLATISIAQASDPAYAAYLASRSLDIMDPLYRRNSDADGDGLKNYFEYQAGFDLLDPDSRLDFYIRPVANEPGVFEIHYTPANPSQVFVITFSSNQKNWSELSQAGSATHGNHRVLRHRPNTPEAFYRIGIATDAP